MLTNSVISQEARPSLSAEDYCGRLAEAVAGVCEAAADHQRAGKVRKRRRRPLRDSLGGGRSWLRVT
eukprot:COSAG01_NODE_9065_length_2565_cov_1.956204_4_plen_67_part_00